MTREKALRVFIDSFNKCYPNWKVDGGSANSLTKKHVEYGWCRTYHARCGTYNQNGGDVVFKLNTSWWNSNNNQERVALIAHELGHIKHPSTRGEPKHSPHFWNEVIDNYKSIRANARDAVESTIGDVDWSKTDKLVATNPHSHQVDYRSEVVCQRQYEMSKQLDVLEEVSVFDGMKIIEPTSHRPRAQVVDISDLEYAQYTLEELCDFFYRQEDGIERDGLQYSLEMPRVSKRADDTFVVSSGDAVVNYMDYIGQSAVVALIR